MKDESPGIGLDRKELERLAAGGEMITVPASFVLETIQTIERHEEHQRRH